MTNGGSWGYLIFPVILLTDLEAKQKARSSGKKGQEFEKLSTIEWKKGWKCCIAMTAPKNQEAQDPKADEKLSICSSNSFQQKT